MADTGTAVDFLLEHLKLICNQFSEVEKLEIMKSVNEDLSSLRTFLVDSDMSCHKHEELKNLVLRITDCADKAEDIIDSSIVSDIIKKNDLVYFISDMFINTKIESFSLTLDSVLEYLDRAERLLMNYEEEIYSHFSSSSSSSEEDEEEVVKKKLQIKSLCKRVRSYRIFLEDSGMDFHKRDNLKDLVARIPRSWSSKMPGASSSSSRPDPGLSLSRRTELCALGIQIRDVATETKDMVDLSILRDFINEKKDRGVARTLSHVYQSGMLINVLKELKSLRKEVSKIYENKLLYGIPSSSSSSSSTRARADTDLPHFVEEETVVVGFDNHIETIRERLTGAYKQLDVLSIVGMAGLGKTTLATKLYNDAYVVYHFYIRGWTYVSQVYAKRDLLLRILSSTVGHRDRPDDANDEKLGEELYKSLKGKRYLIVMDDMWNIGAWDDMKIYFPNDNNGSRIIITSRLTEVALHAKPESLPYLLHLLTEDESWDLLKQKVFGKESCTPDLAEIGEKIAHKCQGLPLAIVVVAGLLARTDKKKEEWEKVAESLSSHIASDSEQFMNTLELSYNHLPRHLRLCFLYFGAFPEDYEIRVSKLIWLWIAEGFIHQIGQKTLEDVAKEYLTDLIGRSLVLVANRKFNGGIRACRVHDLLHDLCSRKGKEVNFMQQIYRHKSLSSNDSFPIGEKQRRLCIFSYGLEYVSLKSCAPHIRSLLCFDRHGPHSRNILWICQAFKLLRVLDLSKIFLSGFPSKILQLVLLRYLELRGHGFILPKSISEYLNLETLNVSNIRGVVPPDIWKMVNLRHLLINGKNYASPPYNGGYDGYPFVLHNLLTISQLCPMSCQVILARTPNLRKLGFYGRFKSTEGNFWFPDLHFLNHLEKLKFTNTTSVYGSRWSLQGLKFPPNLRRLTLFGTKLDWEEMSTLGMLCYLEVLKLEDSAFVGPKWETTDEGFQRLKFLRLKNIDVKEWEASDTDFPSLQQLVLRGCRELEGIPLEFGNIPTLQRIEVTWCSQSTENSAKEIQEDQQSLGNYSLEIHIKERNDYGNADIPLFKNLKKLNFIG